MGTIINLKQIVFVDVPATTSGLVMPGHGGVQIDDVLNAIYFPKRNRHRFWVRLFIVFLLLWSNADAQVKKVTMRDSTDKAFDLSNYIIEAKGFIPVPVIITEPALGGFGGGMVPVFIQKKPSYADSVGGNLKVTPIAPDLTGAAAVYTLNNTYFIGAFRRGTLVKRRIKYTAGGGYGSINMSFFRTIGTSGEKEYKFNIKTIPVLLQATKRIGTSYWYMGLKYLLLQTKLDYVGDPLLPPDFAKPREYKSLVSQPGAVIELDNLDNIFTPNKGMKAHVDANWSDNIFGSDYDFVRLNMFTYAYSGLGKNFVGGLRIDGQQTFGDPPFFMLPYLEMRGVPIFRYQGKADVITEAEVRWDFTSRWSMMFFSGAGKAFDDWSDFGAANLVVTYGTGFRYFIARKFGLRMGLDIAKGPDSWGYYIVFGSNWLK